MQLIPVLQVLDRFGIGILEPKEILYVTGAGISAPAPTAFPLGGELYELLLRQFSDLSDSEITSVTSPNPSLPFEMSCQRISDTFAAHGLSNNVDILWSLVSELFTWRNGKSWKQANDLHAFFGSIFVTEERT